MSLPAPKPGLVVCYSFLWRHEAEAGEVEGRKNRPCALIAALETHDGDTVAIALPITHTRPKDPNIAVEIPPKTKRRLGLDGERSWVICSEANKFIWPGPDLHPISRQQPDKFDYGYLPQKFLNIIKARIQYLRQGRRLSLVSRG